MKQVTGICTSNQTLASCDNRVLDSIESSWQTAASKGKNVLTFEGFTVPFFMVLRMTSRHVEYLMGAVVSVEYFNI